MIPDPQSYPKNPQYTQLLGTKNLIPSFMLTVFFSLKSEFLKSENELCVRQSLDFGFYLKFFSLH